MDKSFLANLTIKPTPKEKNDFTVKVHKDTPILDVVTSDLIKEDKPFIKKDDNMLNPSIREELLLKFNKKKTYSKYFV